MASQEVVQPDPPVLEETEPESEADAADRQDVEAGEADQSEQPAADVDAAVGQPVDTPIAAPEAQQGDPGADDELTEIARRDLAAQDAMAEASRDMVTVAWVAAGVTGVGVGLIFWTLIYTRRAAEYTKVMAVEAAKATKAANDTFDEARKSNEIARNNLIAQHRPWLTLTVDRAGPLEVLSPGSAKLTIEFSAKNIGSGPAVLTMYDAKAFWTHEDWPSLADLEELVERTKARKERYPHANILVPKDTTRFGFVDLNLAGVDRNDHPDEKRRFSVVVACCLVYKSMLSDQWFHAAHVIYVSPKKPPHVDARAILRFKWAHSSFPADRLVATISKSGGTSSIA